MTDLAGPFTLATLERCEADVAALERAFAGLEDGSFGRCDACGASVEPGAPTGDPFGGRCAEHRQARAAPTA